jgi:maltooligosyltrehalose trehalohydrolase
MPTPARPLAALCTLFSPFTPMLFMGEEYGEDAPFQFFSDHIDEEIAQATRDGRRKEFESFAEFGGEIPDPQDVATFERSKLTRRGDPAIQRLYVDLLALRRRIGAGEAEEISYDESERWLRVRRAGYELVCNFSDEPRRVPCIGMAIELATGDSSVSDGHVELEPLSGALVR